jgi:hypothetical protein
MATRHCPKCTCPKPGKTTKAVHVELNDREAKLLEIVCLLDISVPATVAKFSRRLAAERQDDGVKRRDQKDEIGALLFKIRQTLYGG